jgi:hypothetical protein
MDTTRNATIFGQKLSQEQAEGLRPGSLVEFKTTTQNPTGLLSEYGNCTVLAGHRLADGVCFFKLTDCDVTNWVVGAAVRCRASRWHDGDVGTFTASDLPDTKAIEQFVASLGIEPDLRIHELVSRG